MEPAHHADLARERFIVLHEGEVEAEGVELRLLVGLAEITPRIPMPHRLDQHDVGYSKACKDGHCPPRTKNAGHIQPCKNIATQQAEKPERVTETCHAPKRVTMVI